MYVKEMGEEVLSGVKFASYRAGNLPGPRYSLAQKE